MTDNEDNWECPAPHEGFVAPDCARLNHPSADAKSAARPALTLDVALYERYLEDSDLTDDQKHAFLETLWSVIVTFVDLGFGIEPVQQAVEEGRKTNRHRAGVERRGRKRRSREARSSRRRAARRKPLTGRKA